MTKDLSDSPGNALSIDVEEWFHVGGISAPSPLTSPWRVQLNVERLLRVLDECGASATFFVLGSVAEALPGMVADIAAAGHEIASHGYSHRLVTELTRSEFRDELRRTNDILGRHTGRRPIGFRAPQWSLSRKTTPWAFEILVDEGFAYDSSCSPLPFVGDPAGSRVPFLMKLQNGRLWEIPPMVSRTVIGNLPTGGGWGFRFFPVGMIERTIRRLNSDGAPAVLFLHPRELDPDGPRLQLSPIRTFAVYGPRKDAMNRLVTLLRQFRFTPLCRLVEQWESA